MWLSIRHVSWEWAHDHSLPDLGIRTFMSVYFRCRSITHLVCCPSPLSSGSTPYGLRSLGSGSQTKVKAHSVGYCQYVLVRFRQRTVYRSIARPVQCTDCGLAGESPLAIESCTVVLLLEVGCSSKASQRTYMHTRQTGMQACEDPHESAVPLHDCRRNASFDAHRYLL